MSDSNILKKKIGKRGKKKPEEYSPYWGKILKARRERKNRFGEPILDPTPADKPSNGCYPLDNKPLACQVLDYNLAKLTNNEVLKYDCFMPTGEVYEFLPCAPYGDAGEIIGYKKVRGTHHIMAIEGEYNEDFEAFVPYKLLMYRGRFNNEPEKDDNHRFVYLAQNKPGEPLVGDCFIRLEEIHNRMRGVAAHYIDDCDVAVTRAKIIYALNHGTQDEQDEALMIQDQLQQEGRPFLTFRCWAVEGFECVAHERELFHRLFAYIGPDNNVWDHFEVFRVWSELLRKSQGDKLASKDFFGRYWDVVIPNNQRAMFQTGFKIVVGAKYIEAHGFHALNPMTPDDRLKIRKEVFEGVNRANEAPRLKFKPPLTVNNVIFWDQVPNGWRHLEAHPGGLYNIVVDGPVQGFLTSTDHDKPLWQANYTEPDQLLAEQLQGDLDKCGKTDTTTTHVEHDYVVAARKGKRKPTQDRVVATNGYSANLAMAKVYPGYYPDAAKAKKRRVAEWLHRSAFSYGGLIKGDLGSSQVPNNLVLGTPDTNTVMMRYEAFVKRLAYYTINQHGQQNDTVVVKTVISYPVLQGHALHWMANDDHKYTWLAPKLIYDYRNDVNSRPHVADTRNLFPLNRETSMLFQSLVDKSLEEKCWGWKCWDDNDAVAEALIESTGVDGDEEDNNEEELGEMLQQDLAQREQQV